MGNIFCKNRFILTVYNYSRNNHNIDMGEGNVMVRSDTVETFFVETYTPIYMTVGGREEEVMTTYRDLTILLNDNTFLVNNTPINFLCFDVSRCC